MDKQIDIIMGQHAALAAIENLKRVIISLKCTKEFFEKNKFVIENRGISKLYIVSRKEIDSEIKNNVHQGILLKCKSLKQISLEEINKNEKNIVILDSLNDSQNVGSILRTSYLFGIKTIISNKDNSFKINPFLIKSASGAFEKINFIEVINLNRTVEKLKKMGYWIVGFDMNAKSNISEVPKDLKKVLIFGSEGKGIRPLILKNCDFKTKISLKVEDRKIDSLNVSNCVSIALYECLRK
jgi:23S rRNA (guanosine2251-2'-O)-methyltransferase